MYPHRLRHFHSVEMCDQRIADVVQSGGVPCDCVTNLRGSRRSSLHRHTPLLRFLPMRHGSDMRMRRPATPSTCNGPKEEALRMPHQYHARLHGV